MSLVFLHSKHPFIQDSCNFTILYFTPLFFSYSTFSSIPLFCIPLFQTEHQLFNKVLFFYTYIYSTTKILNHNHTYFVAAA